MKITVDVDEQLGKKIDLEAKKDGHTNRNAVIRKVLNLFFADKFSCVQFADGGTEQGEDKEIKND